MVLSLETLFENLAAHADRRARFMAIDGKLVTTTFVEMHADVVRVMAEMRACGLGAGDLVGLLGPNSYDWIVADLALLGMDCISVALPAETAEEPQALVERYELAALLVDRSRRALADGSPATAVLGDRPLTLTKRQVGSGDRTFDADVFTVAFSSGTAGTKKGLLLSKKGVTNTVETSGEAWRVGHDDDILVVMPFSNFQQRYLFYTAIWYGCSVTVIAPERMFQQLRKLEPTILLGPPSFFEILEARMRAAGRRERLAYHAAVALHAIAPRLARQARARLGRRWTSMYGSRARLMLTGSAPVPPRLVTLFHQLGAPLFEVYGSTEIGWISFNLPHRYRLGTAGRPVDGVVVTLTDEGEIVVRAERPQALGYVFDGTETAASVFLPDGAIATGDLGRWERGYLRLVGRKKNVIITRSGVKINPEELEHDVEQSCAVKKAVVVPTAAGTTLACVVWVDGWDDPERARAVEACVGSGNDKRPASHRISQVVVRPADELSVESGLLTRNLKVDRDAVVRTVFPDTARSAR